MTALLLAAALAAPVSAEAWAADALSRAAALLAGFARPAGAAPPRPVQRAAPASRAPLIWRGAATTRLESAPEVSEPFDRAVVSWNADGPVLIELEAHGRWHTMGRWGARPESVPGDPRVRVDTLALDAPATALRWAVTPAPGTTVKLVAVTRWRDGDPIADPAARSPAWGRVLAVPQRSQTTESVDAARVCSPTSLGMVLVHHGVTRATRAVAQGVYDHAARLYGNWPFNTAYAHSVSGLEAFVARAGFEELEAEVAAGRPVIISHRWSPGELRGAPISSTDGHVIVVVGFTPDGDVVVNDPAARPGSVRRTYRRADLRRTWLEKGRGIAYFLRPAAAR
ncbi:MAG: C39 family peptidase [Elusimicrobiota bacterium]|nr:C39 family peptidase [Elusimicrobiota bacterium]